MRSLPWAIGLFLFPVAVHAQSYGLLIGACHSDLYTGGQKFDPGQGLAANLFVPFYVNDRIVLRAEAGLAAFRASGQAGERSLPDHYSTANVALLSRFYVLESISLGVGLQGVQNMGGPRAFLGNEERTIARNDLMLLLSAAYRVSDRFEVGLRYGRGLLTAVEVPVYGAAHRRHAMLTTSFLLRNKHVSFVERQTWRSRHTTVSRY
jgi:hypothetical protein